MLYGAKIVSFYDLESRTRLPIGKLMSAITGTHRLVSSYREKIARLLSGSTQLTLGNTPLSTRRFGTDSIVSLTPQGTVQKTYHRGINIDLIKDYHSLHKDLSGIVFSFNLQKQVRFKDKKGNRYPVSTINFTILDLGNEVSEVYINPKEARVVTEIPFIEGESLGESSLFFLKTMGEVLNNHLGFPLFINSDGLHPENIKVTSISDGILSLTITDLGASIQKIIEKHKILGKKVTL